MMVLRHFKETRLSHNNPEFTLHLAKEYFKFSAAHFTIFSATHAEPLHGHNYYVKFMARTKSAPHDGLSFDFNELKPEIRQICEQLDEKVLIAKASKHLKIEPVATDSTTANPQPNNWLIRFHKKTYSLPQEDVVLLDLENISSEELARWILAKLVSKWKTQFSEICVEVEETRGQSVSARYKEY